ncbi:hypothetical protein K461DRAFT_136187 [Myriangium duriaei CBS 260.36]|uniref:Uncharacterized protein n=1 Tax=Myriangium duriaei CBS 260.36 TaxID=1168546 RepID=A0A9P4J0D4_9PEZI|nr:hypothetical protein K461DRAFT_136187 [Myriangium duriaei CBS 260.36]
MGFGVSPRKCCNCPLSSSDFPKHQKQGNCTRCQHPCRAHLFIDRPPIEQDSTQFRLDDSSSTIMAVNEGVETSAETTERPMNGARHYHNNLYLGGLTLAYRERVPGSPSSHTAGPVPIPQDRIDDDGASSRSFVVNNYGSGYSIGHIQNFYGGPQAPNGRPTAMEGPDFSPSSQAEEAPMTHEESPETEAEEVVETTPTPTSRNQPQSATHLPAGKSVRPLMGGLPRRRGHNAERSG